MSDLTLALLRYGFLILLWILVISIVGALRRDLLVGQRTRTGSRSPRKAHQGTGPTAPAGPSRKIARELVVTEGPLAGTTLELATSPILLGRAQEATLVLEDDYASSRHARLFPQGSRWFVEDLGSTNGTFLAGSQLTRALPVETGVPIRIGKTVIELRP